jgi:regulator of replication initiation timing
MTITTEEAERFARWCDTDGFTERATAIRSLAAERDALRAENEKLRAALGEKDNAKA